MTTRPGSGWDAAAIRSAIRLLASHPPRIADAQAAARTLRLVWDILQRRGVPVEVFQVPGVMPVLTVGDGPILVITHLDDPHPSAQQAEGGPPDISGDSVSAPGVTRKAAVVSALGAVLQSDAISEQVTLVIEADRHAGSPGFARWFEATEHEFSAAIWETVDLPVPAPALYASATGFVTARVSVVQEAAAVESFYGGVQPDVGHSLVDALAALKSADAEVLVPGFYDGVVAPGADGLHTLQSVAASVGAWLTRGTPPSDDRFSSSHLTLGAFMVPSIVIRDFRLDDASPYLARAATATLEARVMPGQDAVAIERSLANFIRERIPDAVVETLSSRPSTKPSGFDPERFGEIATLVPVAPGSSPAGLLDSVGVPTLGYAIVWRDPAAHVERASLSAIAEGTRTIQRVIEQTAALRLSDAHGRP